MKIRLLTYSTKPRGGVVHALNLAEALTARGADVELWALSPDGAGFFRETSVATHLVPVERRDEPIDERIARYADALTAELRKAGPADIHHAEDCLSARSLLALRDEGLVDEIVRTVHHVDTFESGFLEECQRASIQDVDHRICVSQFWAERLTEEFGVDSDVVANGVDAARFASNTLSRADAGMAMGWGDRPVVLTVGGIEPRKGSRTLLEAFARSRGRLGSGALLAIAGGETLFDYRDYREGWRDDAERLGLAVHDGHDIPDDADVVVLGRIEDDDISTLYRAADVLGFPSTREGFGLVVLEAMAAGLPVVASDIPVFQEHLTDGENCLMVPVGDSGPLAEALVRASRDTELRARLLPAGRATAARFTWAQAAEEHEAIYRRVHAARV
jgi:glycosyltransferase-like protein